MKGQAMSLFKVMTIGGTLTAAAVAGTLGTTLSTDAGICSGRYEIRHGDTLLDIAHDQLGTVFAARHLIDANPAVIGSNPDLIFAGDVLSIPCEHASGDAIDWSVMPDVHTLTRLLRNAEVQVIDIRSTTQVANGVIPGALHLPYSVFETYGDPAQVQPPPEAMSEIVGLTGIRLDQPIIIVGMGPTLPDLERSAAVYRLLRAVGADHVAILRDGYRGWINAGLPVVAFPSLGDPYEIAVTYGDTQLPDKFDILDVVANDGRSSFWEDAAPRPDDLKARFPVILFTRFMGDGASDGH